MDNSWIEYSSNSYRVEANRHGVEVTNLHTGDTRWLQGDDATELTSGLGALADTTQFSSADYVERTDHYLSQYFGG